ncbi:hypothetical protein ACQ4PT_030355 [Festuca glaucescens]
MATEGAEHRRFSLQVDMQCRCTGCVGKVEKAMASIGSFRGVERSVGDVDTGVVAVSGKVNPTEVSQWLKRKTRKDVKIFCPDPPVESHKQVCIPPLLENDIGSGKQFKNGVWSEHEDVHLIEEKIRNPEKVRDTLKIKNLKNELTVAKYELRQSREVISSSNKTLLDSALSQLKAYEKLESLGCSLFD